MVKRIMIWGVGGLGLTVALLIAVAYLLLRASLPLTDGAYSVPGLTAPVTVYKDAQGVPTIKAADLDDLVRASGFIHSQSRFFQMDTLRRSGAGEMAALFGEVAVDFDRERRRWRGRALAEQALENLSAKERAMLGAYTEGVNAGLEALAARPPEYWLLRTRPEPWQEADSLLVNLAMYFYLTDQRAMRSLRMAQMADALPSEVLAFLLDPADPMDAPIVEEPYPALPPVPSVEALDTRQFEDVVTDPWRLFRGEEPLVGSNNWAVSAELGPDGRALLAGDMHLGLSLPNTWYRLRLELDGERQLNLSGVSLPGTPGIIAGSNGWVAWAFTNSYGEWSTRVRLERHEPDDDSPGHYRRPGGSAPIEEHEERIRVRGGEDRLVHYPWTEWGPVVSTAGDDEHVLVWNGALSGALNMDFLGLYQARDLEEASKAAAALGMPPQNILMVDSAGDIGWTIAGRIPRRGNWQQPGEPLPLSSEFQLKGGWLPAADYPRLLRPDHQRLWTANARVAGGEDLKKAGDGGYPIAARQRQIRDRLFEQESFDEADMLAIQLDDEARLLYEWVPLALEAVRAGESTVGRDRFHQAVARWHGHAWPESTGYPLLRDFRQAVHGRALGPLLHPVLKAHPDFDMRPILKRERAVRSLLEVQPPHLLPPEDDDWEALLVSAMDAVIDNHGLENSDTELVSWGERNRVEIQHPFGSMNPLLRRWLNLTPAALPGDSNLPRVQLGNFGASQRMVVSPGDEQSGIFHMPGGQSGHFLSPWYRMGHDDWKSGRSSPFLPGDPQYELQLRPK